jgi:hypothetical protein
VSRDWLTCAARAISACLPVPGHRRRARLISFLLLLGCSLPSRRRRAAVGCRTPELGTSLQRHLNSYTSGLHIPPLKSTVRFRHYSHSHRSRTHLPKEHSGIVVARSISSSAYYSLPPCLISRPWAARSTGLAVASHGQVLLGNFPCLIHMYLMSQVR